ncbi:MAG TPA: choice-of-anchor Q domain-containing protein [Kofleriaceae bacterium]|nr:choice-of-anchor Q domain-containing protein [Kofleriaceae bacterium]
MRTSRKPRPGAGSLTADRASAPALTRGTIARHHRALFTGPGELRRRACLLLTIVLATACTKRNPDLCCTTDAECDAIGFSSHAPCDLGVCVKNECTTASNTCDDDSDCAAGTFCVAGSCAACASSSTCPTAAPVCDAVAHDCRACVTDGECDSGACDLADGTCIDPTHIRYASPTGDDGQPCSRTQPCTFHHASATVDADHAYIVLLPGIHHSYGSFNGTSAIVCGQGASLEVSEAVLEMSNDATVTLRGFQIIQPDPKLSSEFILIHCDSSSLTLQDMTIQVTAPSWNLIRVSSGKSLTIQRSTLDGGAVLLDGADVTIDRSVFLTKTGLSYRDDGHSLRLSNSLFEFRSFDALQIVTTDDTLTAKSAFIYNNTFVNGKLSCAGNQFFPAYFEANIFYNTSLDQFYPNSPPGCNFTNNVISASLPVTGTDNQVADPMFVNPAAHDYNLQPISPARDAATRSLANHDLDGAFRPQGVRNDIGAYEYKAPN